MRYLQCGSGPNLVLVHGMLGYSFSWRFVAPELSHQATVFAVDLPGAGFSDRPAHLDARLQACAKRLLRFFDVAGIGSCGLLASSHGGAVAMMAAALAPKRIRRLILAAPVNPWSFRGRELAPLLSNPLVARILLALVPRCEIFHEPFLRRLYGDTRRIRLGTLEGYARPLHVPGAFRYPLAILHSWKHDLAQLESMLPRIAHIQTLLIWGSLDRAVDPNSAERLHHQFKHCRLIILDGVGHLPYEEVPEEFNRIVGEFLVNPNFAVRF